MSAVRIGDETLSEDQVHYLRSALTVFLVDARRANRKGEHGMQRYVCEVGKIVGMLENMPAITALGQQGAGNAGPVPVIGTANPAAKGGGTHG